MNCLRRLFAHYKLYHLHGPLMLKYAGFVGAFGFPIFYALRFTKSSPPYDDSWIRLAATLICVLLVLKDRWPEKLKPYYIAFSYPALIFSLPVFLIFTSLKNGGDPAAVGNTLMVSFFVILMTDWRNTIVMLVVGIALGVLLYFAVDPHPVIPAEYAARLPLLILVVVGGSFFKFAGNQAAAEAMRRGYASLAGSIAHEMRNPLGQIKHNLERMQQALPAPTTSEQGRSLPLRDIDALYCHLAESELAVKRGLQVIAMTLDQVSEKPMDAAAFSYVSAAKATHKAVQEYGYDSDAERAKVSVRVIDDFSFRGDETAYLFVLFNLIKNALYYFPLHPQALLTITVEHQQVKVRDTGPGIAPAMLARLFEPFRSGGKSGGTGLGLAYCQRVMHGFGGQINCSSVEGRYTEFSLRFPPVCDKEREAQRLAVLEAARSVFAGKRLLVVDDDAVQLAVAREKLRPLGAYIDQAPDGRAAMHALAQQRYDLVLLDLHMPAPDGYAVAGWIRAGDAPANRDVRIVAHTSEPAHLAAIKAQKAGIDGLVSKPCDQLPLVQALLDVLARRPGRDEPAAALAGRRILLADDNAYNRKAVAAYLRQAGADVAEAGHGRAVLDWLEEGDACDAILMDLRMPGMGGLDAANAIRRSAAPWRGVPIIALTAHSDAKLVQAARVAGMDDFITKPVEPAELYAKLQRLVGGTGEASPAPVPQAESEAGMGEHGPVLNLERLESYRRIGMLDELLNDYIPEISRLVDRLEQSAAERDLQASLDGLHSLLGISGEAGAQALHRLVRQVYAPMVDSGAWPAEDTWFARIRTAAAHAQQALQAYAPPQSTVTAT